jgi:alginate O-acetyltransferase complex protein AlgI
MLFNSTAFMVFLPLVFAAYWLLGRGTRLWQNAVLLIASYVFYGWWDWRFLLLLVFSTALDFLAGMMIHGEENEKRRTRLLWVTVALNLGLLGFFKYFNFFMDSTVRVLETLGFQANPWSLNVLLPIGISFYTFHGLSYVVDIYFRRIAPNRDPMTYGVFVCYFPLLVAGPIERATNLLPQLEKPRSFDYRLAIDGFRIILWGFFKKLVIADSMAQEVNEIFASPETYGGGTLALGAVYFAIQVYCDFSGYTDIARGVSRLFGIEVLDNFKTPYLSRSIPEFWSRWHISLSSWLNDYVFTPLAIEFRGWGRHGVFAAVFLTFLLSGLWHGPAWHFVAWGALHGLLYLPHVYGKKGLRTLSSRKQMPLKWKDIPGIVLTFTLVCLGYVLFRAESLSHAAIYLKQMVKSPFQFESFYLKSAFNLLIPVSFVIDWLSSKNYFTGRYGTWYLVLESVILAGLTAILGNFGSVEFIYFQF